MPPDDQLSDEQVRVLNEWVAMGAPWPASEPVLHGPPPRGKHRIVTEADRQFWSFQPVKNPPLPTVRNADWCRNEIDRFVLEKLESEGLAPGPQASRDEFIRRATFDLTAFHRRRRRWMHLPPIRRPTLMKNWSIDCWPARAMASGGGGIGLMSCVCRVGRI